MKTFIICIDQQVECVCGKSLIHALLYIGKPFKQMTSYTTICEIEARNWWHQQSLCKQHDLISKYLPVLDKTSELTQRDIIRMYRHQKYGLWYKVERQMVQI